MLDYSTFKAQITSQYNGDTKLSKHIFNFSLNGYSATIEEFTDCLCPSKVEAAKEKMYTRYKQLLNV